MNTNKNAKELIESAEKQLKSVFDDIDKTELINTERVLNAFRSERIAAQNFAQTNGYGYDDIGRDALDRVFAKAYFCEDALVRTQFASGTHTIYLALDGLLRYGDSIIFASGEPYDTLQTAIENKNSFANNGVKCINVELRNGKIDVDRVLSLADNTTKIVYIQRSRGYCWRDAILPEDMEELFTKVHKKSDKIITVVDNCYGEFTCENEPSCFGADVMVGSLIKNAGGGLAPTGGYICGKKKYISIIEDRMTVPGMGREIGSYAASYMPLYEGLFVAPHVTAQALKTAVLFAKIFEMLGLETLPASDAKRSDIVQSLKLNDPDKLVSFCRSIQACSPVDSYVVPEPWDMPGYNHQVIMAAGTFVQGSSIELTADGPMREPYIAYVQGALTYAHGKLAAEKAIAEFIK